MITIPETLITITGIRDCVFRAVVSADSSRS